MSNHQPAFNKRPVESPHLSTRRRFLRNACGFALGGVLCQVGNQILSGAETPDDSSPFGASAASGGALIGIFYDLKQDQKGNPLSVDYLATFAEFVNSGWDEAVLSRFFRVTRPIYATEVFTPYMPANEGPKAFGVGNLVKPSHWMVIYKGQVSPPEDGVYRFVGAVDDILAVAVNGKTVLVADWSAGPNPTNWVEPDHGVKLGKGAVHEGDWFTCRKDQPIDLDILIGEFPGGKFGAWLTYQKQGVNYPLSTDPAFAGKPVLPVFQLAHHAIAPAEQRAPYTTDAPPWTGYQ